MVGTVIERLVVELQAKFVGKSAAKSMETSLNLINQAASELGTTNSKVMRAMKPLSLTFNKVGKGGAEFFDRLSNKSVKFNKAIERMKTILPGINAIGTGMGAKVKDKSIWWEGDIVGEAAGRIGTSVGKVNDALARNNWEIRSVNEGGKAYQSVFDRDTQTTMKLDRSMKGLGKSLRGFRFENLSFLFFGMQLQRTFGGMVKQVTSLIGTNEIWAAVVQTILLPILLPLIDVFLAMLDFFSQHPLVAKMVGYFIVFAAVLGTIMFWAAQIALLQMARDIKGLATAAKAGKTGVTALSKSIGTASTGLIGTVALFAAAIAAPFIIALIFNKEETMTKLNEIMADIKNKKWAELLLDIDDLVDILWKSWEQFQVKIVEGIGTAIYGKFEETIKKAGNLLEMEFKDAIDAIWDYFKTNLIDKISEAFVGSTKIAGGGFSLLSFLETLFKAKLSGGKQFGGMIPQTGLYMMHKGESVTSPTGIGGGNTSATFNINVSGGGNARQIADEVMNTLRPEFERITGSRRI